MFLWIALLSICTVFLYRLSKAISTVLENIKTNRLAGEGVPCKNRHWFYGNAQYYSPTEIGLKREVDLMQTCKKCFQKWYGPTICFIMGYHPDIVRPLLSSSEPKNGYGHRHLHQWIGDGLITSNGEKWKRNRRLLTPIFHFHSLKRYLTSMNDAAMITMNRWKARRSIDAFQDVGAMSLDILLRCMLSKDSRSESGTNEEYLNAVTCLTKEFARRSYNPFYYFDSMYFLTSHGKNYKNALRVVHDFTDSAIKERIESRATRPDDPSNHDFLDVLLLAKDDNGRGLTGKEIRDELDTFVFAGHDTVTSAISWTLYNMALYPDLQQRCRNEVIKVLNGQKRVEWKHLSDLQYLTNFIKESMRMYPPVFQVGRRLSKPMFFSRGFDSSQCGDGSGVANGQLSKTVPKNGSLSVRISLLHRNPLIWKNPDVFDPERFSPERSAERSPHAYVPFSSGPRNCIGQNFAMNEMKVVLALALSMFKFSLDTTYPKPERELYIVLRSKTGIHLLADTI